MKPISMRCLAAALMLVTASASGALAQERTGDAALGALSGAVVLGPVGAVAGALIGYTAGPAISHSWGVRRSEPPRAARPARRAEKITPVAPSARPNVAAYASSAAPADAPARSPAPAASAGTPMPPVQSFD